MKKWLLSIVTLLTIPAFACSSGGSEETVPDAMDAVSDADDPDGDAADMPDENACLDNSECTADCEYLRAPLGSSALPKVCQGSECDLLCDECPAEMECEMGVCTSESEFQLTAVCSSDADCDGDQLCTPLGVCVLRAGSCQPQGAAFYRTLTIEALEDSVDVDSIRIYQPSGRVLRATEVYHWDVPPGTDESLNPEDALSGPSDVEATESNSWICTVSDGFVPLNTDGQLHVETGLIQPGDVLEVRTTDCDEAFAPEYRVLWHRNSDLNSPAIELGTGSGPVTRFRLPDWNSDGP